MLGGSVALKAFIFVGKRISGPKTDLVRLSTFTSEQRRGQSGLTLHLPTSGGWTMRGITCTVVCALVMLTGAATVGAQQFTGGVRGAVRDANGIVPGVTVTLTNEATGISREVVTNDVGQYNFPAVTPGTYTLKAQIGGYKNYESKGLTVGKIGRASCR